MAGITVRQGECTAVDLPLVADADAVEEVVVEARADARREAAVLAERKKAATISDAVSAQEISRTPDSSASDAVKRVVSATVVDGKYVYVRGLGGRYSSVLLNGVPLPSPDADEHAVPLDLFPTSLLSSLNVVKTWSPELPGSFAGGTLKVDTSQYPRDLETEVSISGGGNSAATGKQLRRYDGGSWDFLGFDDGTRALPDLVPQDGPMAKNRIGSAAIVDATRSFKNQWQTQTATAAPGTGLGVTIGDTRVVGERRLGYLLSLDYGLKESVKRSSVSAEPSLATATTPFGFNEHYDYEQGTVASDLSGLANLGLELDSANDLSLLVLYTRSAESKAQQGSGRSELGDRFSPERLQFVSRGMLFGQLRGSHRFRDLGALELSWQGNLASVSRDEPDTRDVRYVQKGTAPLAWDSGTAGSADRFFSEVRDTSGGAGVDVALSAFGTRLRAGGSAQLSDRSFDARRFRFKVDGADVDTTLPPDDLFAPGNVSEQLYLQEITAPEDAYDAQQRVYAGYLSADVPLRSALRLVAGVRLERAEVELTPGSRFTEDETVEPGVDRHDSTVLPGANVIWSLSDRMNVRAAYAYTVVRPQFRELAPCLFVDFDRKRTVEGNPRLETTRIHNADVRWEWFLGESEVLAASFFSKTFDQPIEAVLKTGAQVKFENTPGATVYGAELEGRLGLRRVSPVLADFRAGLNVALVDSEVELPADTKQTSKARPLQGQSPYVVNASLGWARGGTQVNALYNVHGERIAEVGSDGLPDAYEQPFHRVDLTLSHEWRELKAKLALTNLLASKVVVKQGGLEASSYEPGIAGSVSLEWSR
jgi:hypothetical protein